MDINQSKPIDMDVDVDDGVGGDVVDVDDVVDVVGGDVDVGGDVVDGDFLISHHCVCWGHPWSWSSRPQRRRSNPIFMPTSLSPAQPHPTHHISSQMEERGSRTKWQISCMAGPNGLKIGKIHQLE